MLLKELEKHQRNQNELIPVEKDNSGGFQVVNNLNYTQSGYLYFHNSWTP